MGAACIYGLDVCAGGACNYMTNVCAPLGPSCYDACPAGQFCDSNDQTCKPATLPAGAGCGIVNGNFVNNDCVVGTACTPRPGDVTPPVDTTCAPIVGEGAVCVDHGCEAGLYCHDQDPYNTNPPPRTCQRYRALGESCSNDPYFVTKCSPELECRGDVCQTPCK
jgi:hypothetical protein